MKKIVLLCAGGMSTSLMVTKMKDYADSIGFECEINAYAVNTAAKKCEGCGYDLAWAAGSFQYG
ncbi:PTS sugar transporter subunit IIB [Dielma fastidiosa]|uniref:PTS sugar transporter subunit IIB n=1 Tax=Dielma fastidiosa TaxID=1034346 RepID=UPI0034BBA1E0